MRYRTIPELPVIEGTAAALIAAAALALAVSASGCATVQKGPETIQAPVSREVQREAQEEASTAEQRVLKRKIAISRFTNETRYGKTLLGSASVDPLGKQVSDMLSVRLVQSARFMVFERQGLADLEKEQKISGAADLVGVDAVILGSITEFGRTTTGTRGFLSATKKQTARAKVEVRLVDPRTAHSFFSASGTGEASSESGEVAGYGSQADYDATLNDRAIGAAITDLMSSLVSELEARPWRTDVLKLQGDSVVISGGRSQGLRKGDVLAVFRRGEQVESSQTGFKLRLPPSELARVEVLSFFGDDEWHEGSMTRVVPGSLKGSLKNTARADLFVAETGEDEL